jgi:hypothetical protein
MSATSNTQYATAAPQTRGRNGQAISKNRVVQAWISAIIISIIMSFFDQFWWSWIPRVIVWIHAIAVTAEYIDHLYNCPTCNAWVEGPVNFCPHCQTPLGPDRHVGAVIEEKAKKWERDVEESVTNWERQHKARKAARNAGNSPQKQGNVPPIVIQPAVMQDAAAPTALYNEKVDFGDERYCPACGTKINPNGKFCPFCGQGLN